jgi:hypothetical protein
MTGLGMNEVEAIKLLGACKPLADHLASNTSYQLTETDFKALAGYYRVFDATTEAELKNLSQVAGIEATDIAWLTVALELHYWSNL